MGQSEIYGFLTQSGLFKLRRLSLITATFANRKHRYIWVVIHASHLYSGASLTHARLRLWIIISLVQQRLLLWDLLQFGVAGQQCFHAFRHAASRVLPISVRQLGVLGAVRSPIADTFQGIMGSTVRASAFWKGLETNHFSRRCFWDWITLDFSDFQVRKRKMRVNKKVYVRE